MDRSRIIPPTPGGRFRVLHFFLPLLVGALMLLAPPSAATSFPKNRAQQSEEIRTLAAGVPIERELSGGRSHSYQITLAAGQYLRVIVEQRGIDVVVAMFGPDDQQIIEVDSPNGAQGPEPVSAIAEVSGSYRLEVRSPEKTAPNGRYEVKIEELRLATEPDRMRLAAERMLAEGDRLQGEATTESRRRAISKYEETLPLWRAIGDRQKEAAAHRRIGQIYGYFLSEPRKALEAYHQALPLWRAVGDRT